MKKYTFPVLIEEDEDGFLIAQVPDLPGCHTQAKTMGRLLSRVKEAIELCLEVKRLDKEKVARNRFVGIQQLEVTV
ncbi:type II toxin-antitoxin system HicB family antitoxin [bacterium]|nr:type II toxin-antitoxin system HicB family antitoxin [bacterium]MBU4561484.1 type II toxin-antitoxin system HicB family antitoxin [bacterium]MCG2676309.1 type II toxin-antitoxin system HicB family antitoxin [bacterium]MCG2677646.1 type II toxin-antitoxin system HicB family antitoxin [bacterium]